MIRILLVDDHPSVGEGTKTMIEQDPSMSVKVVLSAIVGRIIKFRRLI